MNAVLQRSFRHDAGFADGVADEPGDEGDVPGANTMDSKPFDNTLSFRMSRNSANVHF